LILAVSALPAPAAAAIIGVAGDGNILIPDATPNTGMTPNFFDDTGADILVHAWNEAQNISLASDILVDFNAPGAYSWSSPSANATIAAGTRISSHLLYFDPLSATGRTATFTFDADIIAIIAFSDIPGSDRLFLTDFLRNPLTVAPGAHFAQRGLESPDSLVWNVNGRDLFVDFQASSPGNQIRVITQAIPEPAALLLMGVGLGVLGVRARARRHRG
jgi:hypothetical protein